jgi:hypothetical protein
MWPSRAFPKEQPMTDYDSPWKKALDLYFRAFLAQLFPHIHDDIDWSRGYEMLDKELQQLLPNQVLGGRRELAYQVRSLAKPRPG